jgi:hypothetical protein
LSYGTNYSNREDERYVSERHEKQKAFDVLVLDAVAAHVELIKRDHAFWSYIYSKSARGASEEFKTWVLDNDEYRLFSFMYGSPM